MPAKPSTKPDVAPALAPITNDLTGPKGRTRVLGHELLMDADYFNVAIASRYIGFDSERERLISERRPADVITLLADLFCDAVLPCNTDWTRERLLAAFPIVVQRRLLDAFFGFALPLIRVEVEVLNPLG